MAEWEFYLVEPYPSSDSRSPLCCSVSLEKKPQIVSLEDKCQVDRSPTRSRGGRETHSHKLFWRQTFNDFPFFILPNFRAAPLTFILSCGSFSDAIYVSMCFQSQKEICWISLHLLITISSPHCLVVKRLIFSVHLLPLFLWAPEEKLMCSREAQVLRVHHLGPSRKSKVSF